MKLMILLSFLIGYCNAKINCKSGVELTIDGGNAPGAGISDLECADGEICLAAEGEVHILDENTSKHKKYKVNKLRGCATKEKCDIYKKEKPIKDLVELLKQKYQSQQIGSQFTPSVISSFPIDYDCCSGELCNDVETVADLNKQRSSGTRETTKLYFVLVMFIYLFILA